MGLVLALLALAPASVAAQEWYDLYEDGLQALRQRKPARAAELIERAVRKRPEPGQNVLTYGTNRLDRYHPYLRLAEAYLALGNVEAARDALRRSEARGREPAGERTSIRALVEAAAARAQATPPAQAPPTTVAVLPLPPPSTGPAATPPPATTLPLAPVPTAAATPTPSVPSVLPAAGTLDLRSEPAGASAFLGDRFLGVTPLRVELAPGTYNVTLRKEGTAEQTLTAVVRAGRRTQIIRPLTAAVVPTPMPSASATPQVSPPLATPVPAPREPNAQSPAPAARPPLPRGTALAAALALLLGVAALVWAFRMRERAAGPARRVAAATARPAASMPRRVPGPRSAASSGIAAMPTASPAVETRVVPRTRVSADQERFGEYRLVEALGKGGMAVVFKAECRGELCALKRPLAALLEDPEFLERFLREAEIGHTLHHPNIIRIFERGEVDGMPYFTMELVRGETLQSRVRREGPLLPKPAAQVIAQVAEALDYAHLKGVVHRDLKPSNIMILDDGTVKVMDYGIARARRFEGLTVTGAFLGTPDYVAPETAEGKGTDARSDLYSLGVVFYEILTGKKPFMADTPFATLRKHCTEPPTPPSVVSPGVPRELEAIILKLLRKDPADRYPGAEELLIELRQFLNRAA